MHASRTETIALMALMVAVAVVTLAGCTAARPRVSDDPERRNRELSEGYALLHDLAENNRQVDQVVRIPFRSVSDGTRDLLQAIAQASGETADRLHEFAEASPALGLDETGLPLIERATRQSIEEATRRDLLAGDAEMFETYVLLSQTEATRYATHLASELAEAETDEGRAAFLRNMQERFDALHRRTAERMMNADERE